MDAYCSSNALLDMNKSSGKFKIKKSEGAILMLSIVFVSIFIPYLVGVNFVVQIASIFPLLIVGLVILPLLYRSPRVLIRRRLGNPKYILLALVLPMPSLIVAVISGVWYAIGYTFLMIAVLTVCQLVLALLPLSSILEAYTRAGVVIILGVMLLNLNGVISSATTASRFSPEYLHPNLLGFIFATFVVVFVWKTINHDARYTTRIFYGVFAILALAIIFLASSRASLLAVFCAVIGAWMIRFTRNLRGRRLFVRRSIPVLLLAAVAGLVFLVESTRILDHAGYLTNLLQIQSSYRGVGSGFSGRIPRWEITISAISQNGLWALGEGYRTGDYNLGFSIDNGYLTIIYENGIFMLLFVVWQLFWLLLNCIKRYMSVHEQLLSNNLLALSGILIVLFVNNFFDRYLLGLGNPASLLGLFLLLVERRDLLLLRKITSNAYYRAGEKIVFKDRVPKKHMSKVAGCHDPYI